MRLDSESISEYYHEMQIKTLPQNARIAFLHQTMYDTVRQAILGEKKDVRGRLDSVQNILVQLMSIIKTDTEETELAQHFLLLYDYLYVKLESADIVSMNDSLQILSVLNDTFDKLIKKRE